MNKADINRWVEEAGFTRVAEVLGLTRAALYEAMTNSSPYVDVGRLDLSKFQVGAHRREASRRLGLDADDHYRRMTRDRLLALELIVDIWTADLRWGQPDAPTFNDERLLNALGLMASAYDYDRIGRALLILLECPAEWFKPGGNWTVLLDQPSALAAAFTDYVEPRLREELTS